MERSLGYENKSRCRHFPLFYVVFIFSMTFMMIHFIQYDPDDKIPQFENFKKVVIDQETTPKPLPEYDYNSLPTCDLSQTPLHTRINLTDLNRKFRGCAFPLLTRYFWNAEGLMFNWQSSLYVCDDEQSVRDIEVRDLDEDSFAVLPGCKEETTLVTLGVKNNTKAEEELISKIPNLVRIGADPFLKRSKVYNKFYNFALSEGAKEITIEVEENGKWVNQTVASKGIKEFLEHDLKLKKIDMLWINPTYGNFPFWAYLQLDGEFRKMGITICQMIIEMPKHMGDEWVKMLLPMEKGSKYIFIRPKKLKNGSIRSFFLNANDPQCTRKYLE